MLLFFAISGIWQTLGIHSAFLDTLATIHNAHNLKSGSSLTSPLLVCFTLAMAASFIATTVLGILLALNFAQKRPALYCLAAGFVLPILLILLRLAR